MARTPAEMVRAYARYIECEARRTYDKRDSCPVEHETTWERLDARATTLSKMYPRLMRLAQRIEKA